MLINLTRVRGLRRAVAIISIVKHETLGHSKILPVSVGTRKMLKLNTRANSIRRQV